MKLKEMKDKIVIHSKLLLVKDKVNIRKAAYAAILLMTVILIIAIIKNYNLNGLSSKQSKLVTMLNGEAYVVVDNKISDFIAKNAGDGNTSVKLTKIPSESKLYKQDKQYFFKSSDKENSKQEINPGYPIILNNGAYLYLYHSDFTMITQDFERLEAKEGTYLSNGLLFNEQNQKAEKEKVILLKLPNGLFMNLQELQVETDDVVTTIDMNSIMVLNEDSIHYYSLKDNVLVLNELPITDRMAMVQFAHKRMTYNTLYERVHNVEETDAKSRIDVVPVHEDLYQYFIGERYDYQGNKTFFRTKNDYFMEIKDEKFFLCAEPMYYAKEPKILLPCDYVLIQPKLFRMNLLPAMSQVSRDKLATYTLSGKKLNTYEDIILFDGTDTYIFFDKTRIFWGEQNIQITPLSTVTVGEDGSIEIYQYKTDKYELYNADGYQEVCATTDNDIKLNLSMDVLYRPDGQEQILFSQPSLLTEEK